jgi:hypothetical protein
MPDVDPLRAARETERAARKEEARPGLIKAEKARQKAEAERVAAEERARQEAAAAEAAARGEGDVDGPADGSAA